MLNKYRIFLWISFSKNGFHMKFPIAFYTFIELLESCMDIIEFLKLFIPKQTYIETTYNAITLITHIINQTTECESFDLIELNVETFNLAIRFIGRYSSTKGALSE